MQAVVLRKEAGSAFNWFLAAFAAYTASPAIIAAWRVSFPGTAGAVLGPPVLATALSSAVTGVGLMMIIRRTRSV